VSNATPYAISIVTLFEEYFSGVLATSLLGKAIQRGDLSVRMINPREFTTDKHRSVDDTPYGGGPGMVLKPEPMVEAIEFAREKSPGVPVVLLSPQGKQLDTGVVRSLVSGPGLILVCGRYEGFDERIRNFVDSEISVGDYVLSGGEPAAAIVIDSVFRHLPGTLGNEASVVQESFSEGLLEYPQYTRPTEFRGMRVPDVLLSGHHEAVRQWRAEQARLRTETRRPDLLDESSEDSE